MRKAVYSILFVLILVFCTGCYWVDLFDHITDPDYPSFHLYGAFFVTCAGNNGSSYPTLYQAYPDGILSLVETPPPDFDPSDYNCGTDPDSPPQPNSSKAAYPTAPASPFPHKSAEPHQSQAENGGSYLARLALDLPFEPLGQQLSGSNTCDLSQPDILQVNHNNALVNRIGTCPFREIAAIPTVTRPLQIAITPDGTTALVTSFDQAINFIDLSTNQVSYTLRTDPTVNPNGIAITPDGTRAYVTSFNPLNAEVLVIDLATKTVTTTIPANEAYPQGAFISPDGSQVWITYPFSQLVDVIDTQTNTYATAFNIVFPYAVAFNSTGTRAYISSQSGPPGTVQVVDTNMFQVIGSYTVGAGPVDVAVLYGDRFVVVDNYLNGTISLIDVATGKVQTTRAVGKSVLGIAIVR